MDRSRFYDRDYLYSRKEVEGFKMGSRTLRLDGWRRCWLLVVLAFAQPVVDIVVHVCDIVKILELDPYLARETGPPVSVVEVLLSGRNTGWTNRRCHGVVLEEDILDKLLHTLLLCPVLRFGKG